MAFRDWSGRPPRGTEANIKLFNVLNNESYLYQLMAGDTGQNQNQNQSMAQATGYLKAMQMNDISELLYHNESHVIDQMIDQVTEILSEKAKQFNCTEEIDGQEVFAIT